MSFFRTLFQIKFETLGSKFRHETAGLLPSFATISKNPHLIRTPIKSRKKRNRFFIVVNTLVATKWLLMLGKFETLGSNFSHETAGLLACFATIKKIHFSSVTKKAKHCLTFQLLFSKLLFSFFENNVFT